MSGRTAPSIISSRPLARPFHSRHVLALQRCVAVNRHLTSNRNSRPIQARATLPRVIAGCGATAVSLFVPLLPSWASELLDDAYLDPSVAESPDLLGTLLIVVVTYFTVMMLYLWLSSFWDEDAVHGSGSSNQQPLDKSDVPPGYGSFLDAHVRSYVERAGGERQVRVLAALDEVTAPLEGENLQQLKARLAAGAAEALDQQIRDVQLLVRTKLLARKLGYTQADAKLGKTASSSGGGCGSSGEVATADIAGLLTTAVLNTPGGLNSCQYKAAIDALVDKELERQLPPGGGPWHDDIVVRGVMRRVVNALVMEESLLLLEGVDKGRRALEAAGRIHQDSRNKWALW